MIQMNKRELSKYYHLSVEIKDLEERIQMIANQSIGASKLTGMPHGTTVSNPVEKNAVLLISLKEKLEKRKEKAMKELIKIEDYLTTIDDVEIRLIFNKRYIELKKWGVIAREMYMSERNVYRKHSDYLKRST